MSDDATRVMNAPDATMVMGASAPPGLLDGRTQIGGLVTCPVCGSSTSVLDPYCGDCGFLIASAPETGVEAVVVEPAAAELVDPSSGRRYRLRSGPNTVGRQGTDVLVNDATVSRHHATITVEDAAIFVEDVGSTNGTKVGDRRIQPHERVSASNGQPLRFGNWTVTLEAQGFEAAAAEPTVALNTPDGVEAGLTPLPVEATAEAPAAAVAILRKLEGPGEDIPITEGRVTIGRRPGNDAVIPGDAYVSGRHAELQTDNSGSYLVDVGSTNGTVVNGEKLAANQKQLLLEGDEVQIGQTRYRFELLEPGAAAEEHPAPESEPAAEAEGAPEGDAGEEPGSGTGR